MSLFAGSTPLLTLILFVPVLGKAENRHQVCAPVVRDGYVSRQVNVDTYGCNILGDAANEPAIAVDRLNPRKIVVGWRQFDDVNADLRQAGFAYSHDGGHKWIFPGSLGFGVFGSDPVLASDGDGVIYYLSIDTQEMRLFRTADAGLNWDPPIQVVPYFYDKPWMAIDTTSGKTRNNIYITAPKGRPFLWSDEIASGFYTMEDGSSPYGYTVDVGPDGNVYVVSNLALSRTSKPPSPGNAPEFETVDIPRDGLYSPLLSINGIGLVTQPWVKTDHSGGPKHGSVYVLAMLGMDPEKLDPGDIVFFRSTDGGQSWSEPVRINKDPYSPSSAQWFNAMSVAPNGRIDVVWYDTRATGALSRSELFYAWSWDGGVTWEGDFAVSLPFSQLDGAPPRSFKLGDYYGMVSDDLGVNIAYAATFNGEPDVYFLRIGPFDCDANGLSDVDDIMWGSGTDCNSNEVPDECELDCNTNAVPDDCDISSGMSSDINSNGVPDECQKTLVVAPTESASSFELWPNSYLRLQDALLEAATKPGTVDEIWVGQGVHRPIAVVPSNNASFSIPRDITLIGGFSGSELRKEDRDAERFPTILSGDILGDDKFDRIADNVNHVVTVPLGTRRVFLEGLTITSGNAKEPFTDQNGGGLYIRGAGVTIHSCKIMGNRADRFGGGIYSLAPFSVIASEFSENISSDGGGIYFESDLIVTDSFFGLNIAQSTGGAMAGKGSLTIQRSMFDANQAYDGGAIQLPIDSRLEMSNSILVFNSALDEGGGLYLEGKAEIVNSTLYANAAAKGDGLFLIGREPIRVANSILWGNGGLESSVFSQIFPSGFASEFLSIEYSIVQRYSDAVQEELPGIAVGSEDPLFVSASGQSLNLRLQPESIAINAGDPAYVPERGESDFDRNPRLLCERVEMGAFEFGMGDFDCDRILTLRDHGSWPACKTNPRASWLRPGCAVFDFEGDSDIDLADFVYFQNGFGTP